MSQTVARKKKNVEWKSGYKEGCGDALKWIASCAWEDLWWMATGKMSVPSWEPCTQQVLNKRETAKYNREKKLYEKCFVYKVCSHVVPRLGHLEFAFHFQGVQDGLRWACDIATTSERERLESAYADFGPGIVESEHLSYRPVEIYAPSSPAQVVVALIQSSPDEDLFVDYDHDSTEFREFWTPFVSEPIDQVIPNLCSVTNTRGHKLRVPAYVEGFIDGALGLTHKVLGDVLLAS